MRVLRYGLLSRWVLLKRALNWLYTNTPNLELYKRMLVVVDKCILKCYYKINSYEGF